MTLYEECVTALGPKINILTKSETRKYLEELSSRFPFTSWGRINWSLVKKHKSIDYVEEIFEWLDDMGIKNKEIILL